MRERVCGLESEMLGVYVDLAGQFFTQNTVADKKVVDFLKFLREKFGAFRTTGVGRVVLPNQSQVYVETVGNFLEICTPECSSVKDLVLHKRVCEAIVVAALREFNEEHYGTSDFASGLYFSNRASDNEKKGVCSCHENYQSEIKIKNHLGFSIEGSLGIKKRVLVPFLIARKLLEGSGLIFRREDKKLSFCISQKLDFIKCLWGQNSTQHRPVILYGTSREEPLTASNDASPSHKKEVSNFTRHQILIGEHNQSPFCNFVKVRSVSLLLEMIEEGYFHEKRRFLPFFTDLDFAKGTLRNEGFLKKVNTDIEGQEFYEIKRLLDTRERSMKLYDVLDMYSEWMLDYLTKNYTAGEKDGLYLEKLEVAKKIKHAAECFSRDDIFALDQDVDWIIKLRWLQYFIKDEAGIEIDDYDFIKGCVNLSKMLADCWPRQLLFSGVDPREFGNDILAWQSSWHQLDPDLPYKSPFSNVEECGVVNPLVIDGKEVDLDIFSNLDKAPMSPPNRTYSRKKLFDLIRKIGVEDFAYCDWSKIQIHNISSINKDDFKKSSRDRFKDLKFRPGVDLGEFVDKFPWNSVFHFYHPQKVEHPAVDEFVEWLENFVILED